MTYIRPAVLILIGKLTILVGILVFPQESVQAFVGIVFFMHVTPNFYIFGTLFPHFKSWTRFYIQNSKSYRWSYSFISQRY
jgi:hypothetical protein